MFETLRQEGQHKKQIQKLADESYDGQQSNLSLSYQPRTWKDIIQLRDWRETLQLSLDNCQIVDNQLEVVTRCGWDCLRELHLYNNKLTEKGVKLMVNRCWPALQYLNISQNELRDSGFHQLLLKIEKIPKLSILHAFHIHISSLGLKQLGTISLKNMIQLNLSQNNICSEGIKYLIKTGLSSLLKLWINKNRIGSQGAKYLSKGIWPNLTLLYIGQNEIGLDGYLSFVDNNWKRIRTLSLEKIEPIQLMQLARNNFKELSSLDSSVRNKSMYMGIERLFDFEVDDQ